jgi:hypothetical protein
VKRLVLVAGISAGLLAPVLLAATHAGAEGIGSPAGGPALRAWSRAAPVSSEPSAGSRSSAPAVLPATGAVNAPRASGAAPYDPPALVPVAPEADPSSQRGPPRAR